MHPCTYWCVRKCTQWNTDTINWFFWRCFAKRNLGFKMGKGVVLRSNVLSFVSVTIRESEVGCAGHAEVRNQSYQTYRYKEQRVPFCSSGSRRDVSVTTSHNNYNNRPLNHSTILPYSFVLDISCFFLFAVKHWTVHRYRLYDLNTKLGLWTNSSLQ